MARLNEIILLVGRRATGKTTFTKNLVKKIPMKTLLVDSFDHPDWREGFTDKSIDDLYNWKSGNIRIYENDPQETLTTAFNICSNCVIVLEDCKRYIEPSVQKWLRKGIIEHRNRNIDLFFQFHSLNDVPPYIAGMHNRIVLFKTNDNMEKRMDKFSNWANIYDAHERIMKHKTPWYNEVITLQ
jgi:hypothetical protein